MAPVLHLLVVQQLAKLLLELQRRDEVAGLEVGGQLAEEAASLCPHKPLVAPRQPKEIPAAHRVLAGKSPEVMRGKSLLAKNSVFPSVWTHPSGPRPPVGRSLAVDSQKLVLATNSPLAHPQPPGVRASTRRTACVLWPNPVLPQHAPRLMADRGACGITARELSRLRALPSAVTHAALPLLCHPLKRAAIKCIPPWMFWTRVRRSWLLRLGEVEVRLIRQVIPYPNS